MSGKVYKIWGWILTLILPGTAVLWILISLIFFLVDVSGSGDVQLLIVIKSFINRMLGLFALLGMPCLIVGIILLIIGYSKARKTKKKITSKKK